MDFIAPTCPEPEKRSWPPLSTLLFFLILGFLGFSHAGWGIDYPVDRFILVYEPERPNLPPLEGFLQHPLSLVLEEGIFRAPEETEAGTPTAVGSLAPGARFQPSALQIVLKGVVAYLNRAGLYSVYVVPDREQIDPRTSRDRRAPGDRTLRLIVNVGEIQDLQSVAKGERITEERPIDNPHHSYIIKHSPLRALEDFGVSDVFVKDQVEDYLRRLNRHPGRRVDATVASAGEPGKIDLHYLITENKPWLVYGQVSNTGTESVGEWQYRVGATHFQVFGYDDVFSLDALTSDFETSYSIISSYQIPLVFPDYLRMQVYGGYSAYDGDQFAQSTLLDFFGNSTQGAVEFRASPMALRGLALNFFGGLRYEYVEVTQRIIVGGAEISNTEGATPLMTGYLGLSLDRAARDMNTLIDVRLENLRNRVDAEQLDNLGRLDAAPNWSILKWRLDQSFFLEPLLFRQGFRDLNTWRTSTLAHEVAFQVRGQYVLSEDRVIPQAQIVSGGFYSVRGYPESVAAADHGWYLRNEYRLHVPRLLKPYSEYPREERPNRFRDRYNVRPQRPLLQPDWDLILRAFMDVGNTRNVDRQQFETDQDLWSAGVGTELQLLRNFNLRLDLGWVLDSLQQFDSNTGRSKPIEGAQAGDARLHVLGTLSW